MLLLVRLVRNMLLLIILSCVVMSCSGEELSPSLQFRSLISHSRYKFLSPKEKVIRYRIFSRNLELVKELNRQDLGYTATQNKFSFLSPQEIELYHGVNRTGSALSERAPHRGGASSPPASVSWIDAGHVTAVKNQDGCGACWTFGPTVAIEGAYKKLTGKLKQFSNQELLDCVYDAHTYNACHGGLESRAFQFVIGRRRLALWRDYPYEPVDKRCRSAGKKDGLVGAKVVSFSRNDGSEAGTISRLSQGPLSVAFHAVLSIHFYKEGIYKSDKCSGAANHAVAAVAYSPHYILIKNSWGADWGDQGLFKFGRGDYACGIHLADNNFQVKLDSTGVEDRDSEDEALVYEREGTDPPTVPTRSTPTPTNNSCKDLSEGCLQYFCDFYPNYKTDCRKTCGLC